MLARLIAAEAAEFYAKDDSHGYSQPHRLGISWTTHKLSDGTIIPVQTGDMDCSRLVQICYYAAGVLDGAAGFWTGVQAERLKAAGFVSLKSEADKLRRGDVLLRDGHTAIYMGGGQIVHARASEFEGIDGKTGDQTGREIEFADFVADSWTWAFSYRKDEKAHSLPLDGLPAVIKVKGEKGHYYFDGSALHPLFSPEELAAVDALGTIRRLELDGSVINRLRLVLSR